MKKTLAIIGSVLLGTLLLFAASEGPLSPTVQQNDTWTSSVNMEAQDDTDASGDTAQSVDQITFGFSAVAGTVDGVVVEYDAHKTGTRNNTLIFNLLNVGTCTSKETPILATSDTDTYLSEGSSTDTWSCTALTAANVNNAAFGVSVVADRAGGPAPSAGSWLVDHVRVTVHYTEAASRDLMIITGGN